MEDNIVNQRNNNASLNPYAGSTLNNNYKTNNADIDNLTNQSNQLLMNSVNTQNQAIAQGVETNVKELQRQSDKAVEDTNKQNKAFYQQYQKQINPYGATQEALAAQGLAHSGIAETTKTNIYNTYQKSLTESLNNLQNIKANYNAQIAQVRSQGDIAQAQNLSNAYLQQIEQIRNAYTMAQAQKEFEWQKAVSDRNYNYQVNRDTISDKRYDTEWAYQQARDKVSDQRYADELAYQKERDSIQDEQWNKQFALSQASKSSSGSSNGSSKKGKPYSSNDINLVDLYNSNPYSTNNESIISKGLKSLGKTIFK